MAIFSGMVSFIVLVLGFCWQKLVFRIDSLNAFRLSASLLLVFFLIVGSFFWAILSIFDPLKNTTILIELSFVVKVVVLGFIFWVKVAFGPLLLSVTLAWGIYYWAQYDSFNLLPLFQIVVELLIFNSPVWMQKLYIYCTVFMALFGSLYNTKKSIESNLETVSW